MLLWMRNLVCLWCLQCAEACGNTQTFALTSVGRHGCCQSVADASSMQSFYTVVSRAWHFLGTILSMLFRFHLTHILFILHMPLIWVDYILYSRFDRLFICTSVIHIWKANPTIKTGKIGYWEWAVIRVAVCVTQLNICWSIWARWIIV